MSGTLLPYGSISVQAISSARALQLRYQLASADTVLTCTVEVAVVLLTLKCCLAVTAHVYTHPMRLHSLIAHWYAAVSLVDTYSQGPCTYIVTAQYFFVMVLNSLLAKCGILRGVSLCTGLCRAGRPRLFHSQEAHT